MKKFLSLVAAVLFAAGMMAEPVVLPATLDVTNVSFRSEGMPNYIIAEGDYAGTYFDMGPNDSSNDTLLYAEWDVTIEPLKYDLAVDVYNTNSWRVQIYILNQAGDTLKSLRYKGSSGKSGNFAIGSIDMSDLAAGNYKLRAHAATAWSAMKLKDIIVKADYKGATVNLPGTLLPDYALLSSGASVTNNAIAFAPSTAPDEYATWNVSFAAAGNYTVSIDRTGTNCHNYSVALVTAEGEITVGEGSCHEDSGVKELGVIAVPAAGNYVVKLTNATQWSNAVLNSITFAAAAPAAPKYYIKGSMNNWQLDENYRMTLNTAADDVEYMLDITLAAGDEFKVFEDNGTEQGVWHPGAANSVVDAAHAGDVTIYFRPNGKQGDDAWFYTIIYVTTPAAPEPVAVCKNFEIDLRQGQLGDNYEKYLYIDGENQYNYSDAAPAEYNAHLKAQGVSGDIQHGYNQLVVDVPVEAGKYKVTLGTCMYAYSADYTMAYVKNADQTENLASCKQNYTQNEEGAVCYHQNPTTNVATMTFSVTEAQMVVIKCAHYTPYIKFEKVEEGGTGFENTAVEGKTIKVIENGQLVIIKNGVRYNAVGAQL